MNAISKEMTKSEPALTGLDLLRAPFPPNQISKLPKPTRAQTEAVKKDFKKGIRCKLCGAWHHPDVVHLDYVGHAALTDRLLDADPAWNWEPLAFDDRGSPLIDSDGGMWIRLTVCGQTRLGYGHADGKRGGDAVKELIGDALRNAAMRFGAALDLWHKGELHVTEDGPPDESHQEYKPSKTPAFDPVAAADRIITKVNKTKSLPDLLEAFKFEQRCISEIKVADAEAFRRIIDAKDSQKAKLTAPDPAKQAPDLSEDLGDNIPF